MQSHLESIMYSINAGNFGRGGMSPDGQRREALKGQSSLGYL